MKLVTYLRDGRETLGALHGDKVLALAAAAQELGATGTPSGVALGMTPQQWLKDGDVVEAEVEGIGVLRNRVRAVT